VAKALATITRWLDADWEIKFRHPLLVAQTFVIPDQFSELHVRGSNSNFQLL